MSSETLQRQSANPENQRVHMNRVKQIGSIVGLYKDDPEVAYRVSQLGKNRPINLNVEDHLTSYVDELGRYDLLPSNQTDEHFATIDYGVNVYQEHGISEETKQPLIDLVVSRQTVFLANMRLAFKIARGNSSSQLAKNLNIMDLIQVANVGLYKAIDRFDRSKGFQFSTYADSWIRESVQKAISKQSRTIRVPDGVHKDIRSLRLITKSIAGELGRTPTNEELANELGITEEKVADLIRAEEMQPSSLNIPLNSTFKQGYSEELIDYVPDENSELDRVGQELDDKMFLDALYNDGVLSVNEMYLISLQHGFVFDGLRGTSVILDDQEFAYNDLIRHDFGDIKIGPTAIAKHLGLGASAVNYAINGAYEKLRKKYDF